MTELTISYKNIEFKFPVRNDFVPTRVTLSERQVRELASQLPKEVFLGVAREQLGLEYIENMIEEDTEPEDYNDIASTLANAFNADYYELIVSNPELHEHMPDEFKFRHNAEIPVPTENIRVFKPNGIELETGEEFGWLTFQDDNPNKHKPNPFILLGFEDTEHGLAIHRGHMHKDN